MFLHLVIIALLLWIIFGDKKCAGSVYETEPTMYPIMGVAPSNESAYQRLENCYQNGGVYDFDRNVCRQDYQNMGVVYKQGYTNPQGHIVQSYAHQGNRDPINNALPF